MITRTPAYRRVLWAALAALALAVIAGPVVLADHDDRLALGEGDSVDICHATAADNNPYVPESPAINSEGYPGPNAQGHAAHTGPLWSPGTTEVWGDIIPAYYYEPEDFHYDGLNWTAEGQAIWENDCEAVTATDAPTGGPTEALTDAPTGGPTEALTDAPTGGPTEALTVAPTQPDTAADPSAATTPASSLPLFAVLVLLGSAAAILLLYGSFMRARQGR